MKTIIQILFLLFLPSFLFGQVLEKQVVGKTTQILPSGGDPIWTVQCNFISQHGYVVGDIDTGMFYSAETWNNEVIKFKITNIVSNGGGNITLTLLNQGDDLLIFPSVGGTIYKETKNFNLSLYDANTTPDDKASIFNNNMILIDSALQLAEAGTSFFISDSLVTTKMLTNDSMYIIGEGVKLEGNKYRINIKESLLDSLNTKIDTFYAYWLDSLPIDSINIIYIDSSGNNLYQGDNAITVNGDKISLGGPAGRDIYIYDTTGQQFYVASNFQYIFRQANFAISHYAGPAVPADSFPSFGQIQTYGQFNNVRGNQYVVIDVNYSNVPLTPQVLTDTNMTAHIYLHRTDTAQMGIPNGLKVAGDIPFIATDTVLTLDPNTGLLSRTVKGELVSGYSFYYISGSDTIEVTDKDTIVLPPAIVADSFYVNTGDSILFIQQGDTIPLPTLANTDTDSIYFNNGDTTILILRKDTITITQDGNIDSFYVYFGADSVVYIQQGDTIFLADLVPPPPPEFPDSFVNCTTPTEIVDVINPVTGQTWMDRNLGASQKATALDDASSYGDLFQWGRFADGHQCRDSDTTHTQATTSVPFTGAIWDGKFIAESYNWLTTLPGDLWQGVDGINNPCPSGYRVPTPSEWTEERLSWSSNNSEGAFNSPLKLPNTGRRDVINGGNIYYAGSRGSYWSNESGGNSTRNLSISSTNSGVFYSSFGYGYAIRCIKEPSGFASTDTIINSFKAGYLYDADDTTAVKPIVIDNDIYFQLNEEAVEDVVGTALSNGDHTNIVITYNDNTGGFAFSAIDTSGRNQSLTITNDTLFLTDADTTLKVLLPQVVDTDTDTLWFKLGETYYRQTRNDTLNIPVAIDTSFANQDTVFFVSGGDTTFVVLPPPDGDDWGNQFVISDSTLSGKGTALDPLTVNYLPDLVFDGDSSVTNELQDIDSVVLSGNLLTVYISDGASSSVDLSGITLTDRADTSGYNLTFQLNGNDLELTDGDGQLSVNLSAYLDNTDTDSIIIDSLGTLLVKQRGDIITLIPDTDTNTDEQNLILDIDSLKIDRGTGVNLSKYLDNTDNQNIDSVTFSNNILTVYIEDGANASVNLSSISVTDTDSQTLSIINDTLIITRGNSVALTPYLDNTDTSGYNLDFRYSDDTIFIKDGNSELFVVLPSTPINTDTDSIFVDSAGVKTYLVQRGGTIYISGDEVNDADADPSNEIQTLSWDAGANGNDVISLNNGGGSITITDNVNDADASSTNELQNITLSNANEEIFTWTLSNNSGSDINLIEGTNVNLKYKDTLGGSVIVDVKQGFPYGRNGIYVPDSNIVKLGYPSKNIAILSNNIIGSQTQNSPRYIAVGEVAYGNHLNFMQSPDAAYFGQFADSSYLRFSAHDYHGNSNNEHASNLQFDYFYNNQDALPANFSSSNYVFFNKSKIRQVVNWSSFATGPENYRFEIESGGDIRLTPSDELQFYNIPNDNTDANLLTIDNNVVSYRAVSSLPDDNNYVNSISMSDGNNDDTWDITLGREGLANVTTTVDLSEYSQDLSLNTNTLSLSGSSATVNLSPYLDNTDDQELSIANNILSIEDGTTTIDLTPYVNEDTDLSFSGASSPYTLNSSTGTDVTFAAGNGITLSESSDQLTITNNNPDQVVNLTAGTNVSITGTYPSFTINSSFTDTDTRVNVFEGATSKTANTTKLTFDANDFDVAASGTEATVSVNFPADNNTTYDLSAEASVSNPSIILTPSSGTADEVNLIGGTNVTIQSDGSNNITISSTDQNTTYSSSQGIDDSESATDFKLGETEGKLWVSRANSINSLRRIFVETDGDGIELYTEGASTNNQDFTALRIVNNNGSLTGPVGASLSTKTIKNSGAIELLMGSELDDRNTNEIHSLGGALEIEVKEPFATMFFATNGGSINFSDALDNANVILKIDATNNRVGINTELPSEDFHINGDMRLTGEFRDGNNEAGTSGQILSSTGSITDWKSLADLGIQPAGSYLTTETDPIFGASASAGITSTNISNWNTAYGWGDHALENYLTSEVDGSVSNEGSLSVGAGNPTTSLIQSNTSGSAAITLQAGTNITLSESTNTITISATGDGTGTDDQNISGSFFDLQTGNLTIGIEDGTNETVNLDGRYLTNNENITLDGDVSGSGTTSITVTVSDDSHNHIISNVDGLQTALDGKQPLDADLTTIGGLAKTDDNFIVGNGTTWVVESGSTARTSLGLGSLATLSAVGSSQITDNSVSAIDLNVSGNGTTAQFLRSDGDGSFTWATPTDNNTTYSAGNGISLSGTTFSVGAGGGLTQEVSGLAHANTSNQASINNSNGTVIQDVTLDDYGHVTGLASANLDSRYYTESEVNGFLTTAAVANGAATLATGDQIYDFVIGLNYTSNTGDITSVTGGVGLDGSASSGDATLNLGYSSLANAQSNKITSSRYLDFDNTNGVVINRTPTSTLSFSPLLDLQINSNLTSGNSYSKIQFTNQGGANANPFVASISFITPNSDATTSKSLSFNAAGSSITSYADDYTFYNSSSAKIGGVSALEKSGSGSSVTWDMGNEHRQHYEWDASSTNGAVTMTISNPVNASGYVGYYTMRIYGHTSEITVTVSGVTLKKRDGTNLGSITIPANEDYYLAFSVRGASNGNGYTMEQ